MIWVKVCWLLRMIEPGFPESTSQREIGEDPTTSEAPIQPACPLFCSGSGPVLSQSNIDGIAVST